MEDARGAGERQVDEEEEFDADYDFVVKSIGLKNDEGNELFDISKEPFKSSTKKKSWKPSKEKIMEEVTKRCEANPEAIKVVPDVKRWTITQLTSWLKANPRPSFEADALRTNMTQFMNFLQDQHRRKKTQVQWNGNKPYLRLIHCLLDFEYMREAYVKSFNVKSREELDATNDEHRAQTVFELLAEKFNDDEYKPKTRVFPMLHIDFRVEMSLARDKIGAPGKTPTDALKIKEKLNEMRVKLTRIEDAHSRSGQGQDGRKDNPRTVTPDPHRQLRRDFRKAGKYINMSV
jgi:hypothetical protein